MIPENENEMTEIMELLHEYVPNCVGGSKDIKKIGFAGDQLTVEHARNCQLPTYSSTLGFSDRSFTDAICLRLAC